MCTVAREAYAAVLSSLEGRVAGAWGSGILFLQEPMDGEQLRTVAAFIHALLRCRSVIARGVSFGSTENIVSHVLQLMQHPWLSCCSRTLTRSQRSVIRGRFPPPEVPGAVVYQSDGAARGQGIRGSTGEASYGAVRKVGGLVEGRCGSRLEDTTNNVAEYCGMIACVNDACYRFLGRNEPEGNTRCVFQLDSMLVSKQGNFQWRCLSLALAPYYEQVIRGLRRLEEGGVNVQVMHIYREFNAIADGLANEVLNSQRNIRNEWCDNIP